MDEFPKAEEVPAQVLEGDVGDFCEVTYELSSISNGLGGANSSVSAKLPKYLKFDCWNEECSGDKKHTFEWFMKPPQLVIPNQPDPKIYGMMVPHPFHLVAYRCTTCRDSLKLILLRMDPGDRQWKVHVTKEAEWPKCLPSLPDTLLRMAGQARELLLRGYECESDGYGIGALTYYRRVLIVRYRQLLESILGIAKEENATDAISVLERELQNNKLKKSIEITGDMLPPSLCVGDMNALVIIHEHFSSDIHDATDAECLEKAVAFREALEILGEQIDRAQKSHHRLRELINKTQQRTQAAKLTKRGTANGDASDEKEPGNAK